MSTNRQRYGVLLAMLVAAFFLQGVGADGDVAIVVVTALLGGAVVIALGTADVVRWAVRLAALVALGLVVLAAVDPDGAATRVGNALLVSIGPPAVAIGVIRGMRQRGAVTIAAVVGVLCIYLMVGMLFAFVFGAVDRLGGSPFFANGGDADTPNLLYFSFTTLATVGYGDFTARSDLGHTLAVFEALVGQIYLVTVVSVLVANLRRREPSA
jgi:hypothetical protein